MVISPRLSKKGNNCQFWNPIRQSKSRLAGQLSDHAAVPEGSGAAAGPAPAPGRAGRSPRAPCRPRRPSHPRTRPGAAAPAPPRRHAQGA